MSYAKKKFNILAQGLEYKDMWRGKSRLVIGKEFENGL